MPEKGYIEVAYSAGGKRLDFRLRTQIILNNPSIYAKQNSREMRQVHIACGDGWYHLIDEMGHELSLTARQTGFSIFVSHVSSRLVALRFRWETANELLPSEVNQITDLLASYSIESRSICEVCAYRRNQTEPHNTRCRNHVHFC